jgi:hypothetical protein
MRYTPILVLLLLGCTDGTGTVEAERLKRVEVMSANEMRNSLRVCALTESSWRDCYRAIMLYKDAPAN